MAGDRGILLRFACDAAREALIGLSRQLFNEISGLAACREREAEDTTHGLEKDDWIGSIRERHSLIHSGQKIRRSAITTKRPCGMPTPRSGSKSSGSKWLRSNCVASGKNRGRPQTFGNSGGPHSAGEQTNLAGEGAPDIDRLC